MFKFATNLGSSVSRNIKRSGLITAILLIAGSGSQAALAATSSGAQNPTPTAKISFTFDDGLQSALTQAAPTLAKYGLSGTDYVITGCVGMDYKPNKCHANTNAIYMTWAQIAKLQNTYGWEIGSHTVHHKCLASSALQDPDDCPKTALTIAQVDQELGGSKAALAAHGFNATDFSSPYGDYNNAVLAEIAKYYATHRGFADQNNNDWPYNEMVLNDMEVQEGVTVSQVEAKIDDAIANNRWLVLTMHDIKVKPSKNPDNYQYGTAQLDQIAAYVKAKQDAGLIQSINVNKGPVTSDTNMLANGSFNDGVADGWSTDNPAGIVADSGTHGSYPDPTNSIAFNTAAGNAHLFSPHVSVNFNTTYLLKSFLNVQTISSGNVGFYIDEYDANGNWISGQYRKSEPSAYVEDMNFTYTPSSPEVSQASFQFIVEGTGITGYLDNVQWFPLTTRQLTNLMPNYAFDDGIADGWSTDSPSTIMADGGNNGSPDNPINSVKLTSSSSSGHLFSPRLTVDSSHSYSLINYLDLRQIAAGGEVAFYIDEYDANGNWISGQYKLGVDNVSKGDVGFNYTPSSSNVASASLQVIVTPNSGVLAYVDNIRWYQQ